MEPLDHPLSPELARLFAAKEQRRRELAGLPFSVKVRLVVRLQQMAAPILRARGHAVQVWPLDTTTSRQGGASELCNPADHAIRPEEPGCCGDGSQ